MYKTVFNVSICLIYYQLSSILMKKSTKNQGNLEDPAFWFSMYGYVQMNCSCGAPYIPVFADLHISLILEYISRITIHTIHTIHINQIIEKNKNKHEKTWKMSSFLLRKLEYQTKIQKNMLKTHMPQNCHNVQFHAWL